MIVYTPVDSGCPTSDGVRLWLSFKGVGVVAPAEPEDGVAVARRWKEVDLSLPAVNLAIGSQI